MLKANLRRSIGAMIALAGLIGSPVLAQMNDRFYDPSKSAVPVAQRPAELREALDMIKHEDQALRLRADIWARVAPCPKSKPRDSCFVSTATEGRIYIGPFWFDDPLPGFEIERLWLLRQGEFWSTTEVRKSADNKFEFSKGPAWAVQQPVDVVVKLRGVKDLLQVRFRTLYPVSG